MVGKSIKKWWPVFLLPTAVAFAIGFVWPFIWGIYLSFCKFTVKMSSSLVSRYSRSLDPTYSHAFWLTVLFAFLSGVLIDILAFAIALALTRTEGD